MREPDNTTKLGDYIIESWDEEVAITITVNKYTHRDGTVQWDYALSNGDSSNEWYYSYDEAYREAQWAVGL